MATATIILTLTAVGSALRVPPARHPLEEGARSVATFDRIGGGSQASERIWSIEERAYGPSGDRVLPPVAAIIAVHPPKYNYFLNFMREYRKCPEARAAMDLWPIFSTQEDRRQFEQLFCQECPGWEPGGVCLDSCQKSDPPPANSTFRPLLAHDLNGKSPKSWKKLDGMAQLLELPLNHTYEFALMLDGEIGILNCKGFETLADSLRDKHSARVWYGDRGDFTPAGISGIMRVAAFSMDKWYDLETATNNWTVYTWWNDMPWLEWGSAQRMFENWARLLQTNNIVNAAKSRDSTSAAERVRILREALRAVLLDIIPSAELVVQKMGRSGISALDYASRAFEHMMYQYFTVLHEGFKIEDLADSLTMHDRHHRHLSLSLGERFCRMPKEDRVVYFQRVKPLWVMAGCPNNVPQGEVMPLMDMHRDRARMRRAVYA